MQKNTKPGRRARRTALACGAAALALALAACSSSTSSSNTSSSNTSSSNTGAAGTTGAAGSSGGATGATGGTTSTQAKLAQYSGARTSYPAVSKVDGVAALKGKSVWYVPFGSGVPILAAFGDSMQDALRRVGVTMHVCDGKYLPTAMAACLQQAATQGANAVVTGYIDYALIPTAYDNLVSHNIPVLLAGTPPEGGKTSSPKMAFFDTTDEVNLEDELAADTIIADSNGSAKILYVGVAEPQSFVTESATLKDYVAKSCPKCTLTEITYTAAGIQKLPSQVSAALLANPGVNYVLTQVDAAAGPAVSGIQSASLAGKIKLVSSNGQLDALQRLASGGIQIADVGVSPAYDGWSFADGIIRMMTGQTPEPRMGVIRVFTKDSVSGLSLTPANYVTNAWYGSDTYQDGFLSAWGAH